MIRFKFFYISIWILTASLLLSGCAKPKPPLRKLSEVHKKFIEICKDEYNLPIVVHPLDNTVWIYLPKEEDFLDIKASAQGPQTSNEAKETLTIKFLDGKFENKGFYLEYDIGSSKNYAKDYGYTSQYSEEFQKDQRNILTVIYRAFSDLTINSSNNSPQEKIPDFFILVMADIKKGLEIKTTLYFKDLMRAMTDSFFHEEYVKRVIIDYPTGHTNIIDDKKGEHLNLKELTWSKFLMAQMIYRIQFKFQRSSFPPSSETNVKEEILKVISETLKAYPFEDFESIQLHDLNLKTFENIPKAQLEQFLPKETPPEGKFHVIEFF